MTGNNIAIINWNDVNKIIEDTKFNTDKYGTVVIFTNGNDWYIPTLIHNLIKSFAIHEPDRKIIVFCSDKQGYKKCSELGFKYFEFVDIPELNISNETSGTHSDTDSYTRLSFVKTVLISHILKIGYTPLYLDPDMAFLHPSIDDLLSYLDYNDFVSAGTRHHLNTNIMVVRPTDFTQKLFEVTVPQVEHVVKSKNLYGDEDLLRPRLINNPFTCVDVEKYPPGCNALKYLNVACIIHSNCVKGLNNKIKLMKDCNAWFLTDDLISSEFMVEVKDIYPPFLKGELFETYFYNYVKRHCPDLARKYINVSWTNLYCNAQFKGIPFNSKKLQSELNKLSPTEKYFSIVQFDEGIRHKIPKDTIVFGCCSGDIPIPLTYENEDFFSNIKKKTWDDKKFFCSFLGKKTHNLRTQVYEYVKQFPDYFYYQVVGQYDQNSYVEKCIDSKFCLAPRGFGRSSFRFFEILKFGSIPVYIWDDKDWLPFKDKIDYKKLCVSLNIKDIHNLDSILRCISKEQYNNMIKYHETVKHLFTYDGMCKEIINVINNPVRKICVVTVLIGDLGYKKIAKKNHQEYCDKHGYTYVCLEEKINDFHPMWMKPDLVLSQLKNGYDYVFWMDGDSFFANMNIKLEKFMCDNSDLIATGDLNDVVNAGHLLFKNSNWTLNFIEEWNKFRQPFLMDVYLKFSEVTTHFTTYNNNMYFADQPPVNLILGGATSDKMEEWFDIFNSINLYEGNKYKKYTSDYSPINDDNLERTVSLICDKHRNHVKIVKQSEMNSYPDTVKKGDFIVHFVGTKNVQNIQNVLTRISTEIVDNEMESINTDNINTFKTKYGLVSLYDNEVFIGNEFKNGIYYDEKNLLDLKKYINSDKDILEIGGHCGTSTLVYSTFISNSNKIYVYEPQKNMYALLKLNINQNNLTHKIIPCNKGVFCYNGIGNMNDIDLDGGSGNIQKRYNEESNRPCNFGGVCLGQDGERINLVTIDSMNYINIGFIHCDAQGSESFIFSKAKNMLEKNRPVILFENNKGCNNYLYKNVANYYGDTYAEECHFDVVSYCMNILKYSECIESFNNGIDTLLIP